MRITLSTLKDHPLLPQPWNFEFWTKIMSEEEVGMPLVNIGEIFIPRQALTQLSINELQTEGSEYTSKHTSRGTSCRTSKRNSFKFSERGYKPNQINKDDLVEKSQDPSMLQSHKNSGKLSKRVSVGDTGQDGIENEWEWIWEDDEEDNQCTEKISKNVSNSSSLVPSEPPVLTIERLEEVKEIIEKPEERWRTMWRKSLDSSAPSRDGTASISSINSIFSGTSLAFTNQYQKKNENIIQAGIDHSDPLSLVKVASAKQWKAISKNLTINFDDITLKDGESENIAAGDNNYLAEIKSDDTVLVKTTLCEDRPSTPQSFIPTKVQQLRLICWRVKPWEYSKDKKLFHSLLGAGWGVDCDEVYPNIFVGDEASARNIKFLQKMGITHVLNTAEGVWTDCSFVDLTNEYYEGSGVTYQGIQLWDHNCVKILPYLGCANEFIASGINSGGRVLVHCQMGVSRSSTAAIAYMMLSNEWKVEDVLRLFRKRRDVRPNDFYLTQLVDLDNDLRKLRECSVPRKITLHKLKDIDLLPKPWHYQFWESIPTDETLPFSLSCVCEPRPDMESLLRKSLATKRAEKCPRGIDCMAKLEISPIQNGDCCINDIMGTMKTKELNLRLQKEKLSNSQHQSKRQSKCSTNSNTTSSWEWEYYDDSDDLPDDLEEIDVFSNQEKINNQNKLLPYFQNIENED